MRPSIFILNLFLFAGDILAASFFGISQHYQKKLNLFKTFSLYSPSFFRRNVTTTSEIEDEDENATNCRVMPTSVENSSQAILLQQRMHNELFSESNNTNTQVHVSQQHPADHIGNSSSDSKQISFYTYSNPEADLLYHAIDTPKVKFISWIEYCISNNNTKEKIEISTDDIVGREICVEGNNESEASIATREWLRNIWKQGRLLTNRTEILAVYASDKKTSSKRKRGGFYDYLHMYVDRFGAIVKDGQGNTTLQNNFLRFLEKDYGSLNVQKLNFEFFTKQTRETQLEILQHFLIWFKNRFPYYYDRCNSCGFSVKESAAVETASNNNCNETLKSNRSLEEQLESNTEKINSPFLGYIHPNEDEVFHGKASRAELYCCPNCNSYTRFPRYNSAQNILNSDKGRCGEYSMLLYKFLQALGYQDFIRWVVDWSDHVWVEIDLELNYNGSSSFTHLDPCEAAVDEPYLYQGWGKTQTYIIAFRAPTTAAAKNHSLIEDVTKTYTSDSWEDINNRRKEPEEEIKLAVKELEKKLRNQI